MQTAVQSRETVKNELAAEAVRAFREVPFKLVGSSMLPSLWPGDTVIVRKASVAELRDGDVAQFLRGGRLVTHRIVSQGADRVITQGDSVRRPDAPVEESEIVGRVVSVTRAGRAVDTRFTMARRMGAWGLRRSELAVRVLLKWKRLAGGMGPVDWKYEG